MDGKIIDVENEKQLRLNRPRDKLGYSQKAILYRKGIHDSFSKFDI